MNVHIWNVKGVISITTYKCSAYTTPSCLPFGDSRIVYSAKNFDFIQQSVSLDVGFEKVSNNILCFRDVRIIFSIIVDHHGSYMLKLRILDWPLYIFHFYAFCSSVSNRNL